MPDNVDERSGSTPAGGGPFVRLLVRLRLVRDDRGDVPRLAAAAIGLTWLPLVLLSQLDRTAGEALPLVGQYSLHVRLLVTLPCFFAAEAWVHRVARRCIERFVEGRWAAGDLLPGVVERAGDARDSALAEAALVVLAVLMSLDALWRQTGGAPVADWSRTTPAAVLWYTAVSLPLFHFLGLRWLWRWCVWGLLLFRISRLHVRPIAIHPDERGGLSFLGEPSAGFATVVLGISAMFAADRVPGLIERSTDLVTIGLQAAVIAAAAVAIAFGPVLVFVPCLWRSRHEALRNFGNLSTDYVRAFQTRWTSRRRDEDLLGSPDIQSLADLGSSYDVIRRMKIVPATKRQVLVVLAAALLPLVLLVLTQIPLAELLRDLGAAWLGQADGAAS